MGRKMTRNCLLFVHALWLLESSSTSPSLASRNLSCRLVSEISSSSIAYSLLFPAVRPRPLITERNLFVVKLLKLMKGMTTMKARGRTRTDSFIGKYVMSGS
jgi:hypothetical protein